MIARRFTGVSLSGLNLVGVQPERPGDEDDELRGLAGVEPGVGEVVDRVQRRVPAASSCASTAVAGLGVVPLGLLLRVLGDREHRVRRLEAGESRDLEAAVRELLGLQVGGAARRGALRRRRR